MTLHTLPPPPPPATQPDASESRKTRKWLWVAGLIFALVGGIAIGYGGTPEPEIITKEVEIEVEVEPSDMDERRAELAQREDELEQRNSELDERDEALQSLATELDERDEALSATETEIAENTIPGSGVYLVGEDIKPGTYRSEGGRCYWARLSGTTGQFEDIIANDNVEGTAYVTITASDVAFETSRCGEWTLQ